MESIWHLQRLCSKELPRPGQHQASGRLQRTFVQQLRSEWFRQGAGAASASTREKGQLVIENALEVPRDTLFKAAQQVGGGGG